MFDVLIIGGGHAGVEAANISSQFSDLSIGVITLPGVGLASAPCNPSIGGVGKGQVVKEIDSLGGLSGKLADLSGIQYRTLNESKGYAVQSTRVQIDKDKYSENAKAELEKNTNITIIYKKVLLINKQNGRFFIKTSDKTYESKKIIITLGTFFNGKLHTGSNKKDGGREGCESSEGLARFLDGVRTVPSRFKTGTPPRVNRETVDFSIMTEQESDKNVHSFHVLHGTNFRFLEQKSCYLTYTNENTMKIVRANKESSPMFTGQIKGIGARYCPSIEDKAFRYPEKNVHHIFVEPEGLELTTMYPSGISTSLPAGIQKKMINSIVGLENCEIENYGYAVEYDVLDTTQLNKKLGMIDIPGLFFAGQVNGTSGYEEAAAQGLIAGANAALEIKGMPALILSRHDSYIGVMIEDLVSNIRDEPYRLFTARSENRLFIREDNSTLRMKSYREQLFLNKEIDTYINDFSDKYEVYKKNLESSYLSETDDFIVSNKINVPRRTSISELMKKTNLDPIKTLDLFFKHCGLDVEDRLQRTLAISLKYDGYIERSNESNKRSKKLETKKISWNDLISSENISFECKQRIEKIKPETFGQLKLIEGIRPATLAAVAGMNKRC